MKSACGIKELHGYAGLHHTAKQISKYIPSCEVYVEPFAGMARLHELVNAKTYVYNDKSDYAYNLLKERFDNDNNVYTFNMQFELMFTWDSPNTFFLIDPPWRYNVYKHNDKAFIDRKPYEYYEKIFEYLDIAMGNWIVCGTADERQTKGLMKDHKYKKIIVSDKGTIFGKKARTLIVSNIPLE